MADLSVAAFASKAFEMAHKLRPVAFHIGPVKMIITIRHKNNQHCLTGHYRILKAFQNLKSQENRQ